MDLNALVAKVKSKPELKGLADEFVKATLIAHLKRMPNATSPRDEKLLVKEVRAELRLQAGRFHKKVRLPEDEHSWIEAHSSTNERLPHYEFLKKLIKDLHPRSIFDLGCGLNPLVLAEPRIAYHACDINQEEIDRINAYFKQKGIEGRAFVADIRTLTAFPKTDLCLILKVLDIIDKRGHAHAERLIQNLPCRAMIISFSTRKLSGKRMNFPRRMWIELLLKRLGYPFQKREIDNELFYIVTKPNQDR